MIATQALTLLPSWTYIICLVLLFEESPTCALLCTFFRKLTAVKSPTMPLFLERGCRCSNQSFLRLQIDYDSGVRLFLRPDWK